MSTRLARFAPFARVAAMLVASLALVAVVGPFVSAYDYRAQDLLLGARPPSLAHPCGTDLLGRDLLSRLLIGLRVSTGIGLLAALMATGIGTFYGATAGLLGGGIERLMMRAVDILSVLPFMFLAILIAAIFGHGLTVLFLALALVGWLTTARIVRAVVASLRPQAFIEAARAAGATRWRILTRHILPNVAGPAAVSFTLTVPAMVLQEAFLSFLGLGVTPPLPSLGTLVADGVQQMHVFWWTLVAPGGLLAVLLLACHTLGDGLRDALDPRVSS